MCKNLENLDNQFTLRSLRFWQLQLAGWGFYAFMNIISSIPYRHRPDYIAFRGTFLVASFISSFPMHWVCRALWRRKASVITSLVTCIVASYPLGFACSAAAFNSALWFSIHRPPFTWVDIFTGTPSGWFALVAWSSFYFGVKYFIELETKHQQLIATEIMAQEAQLQALRYQLQPHFLFNTLNAVSTLVLNGQSIAATEMIGKLAHLLRSTLDAPDLHEVPLSDEIAVTEEYLGIEAVRFGDRLSVRWNLDPDLDDVLVPRLILQPLVENAIKHGIARRSRGGFVLIQTRSIGGKLNILIENQPPEESSAILLDGSARIGGIGLDNVRKRISRLYGSESSMHTTTNASGNYEVVLTLPVCYAREEMLAFSLMSK